MSNSSYETKGSTVIADSSLDSKRVSRPIETELGPYDHAIIRDCVNKNISLDDCFSAVTKNRNSSNRPLITMPAVKEYYDKCEKTAAKENCVFTGLQTTNYVDFMIRAKNGQPLGVIKVPVCTPMAAGIAQNGVDIVATVGLTGDLPPIMRVTEGKHLPVLSGSNWFKGKV